MSELLILTQIAIILLFGIIASALAKLVKIPDILLLLLIGVGLGGVSYNGQVLLNFPSSFLISMGILALAIIVFESTSKITLRKFDALSWKVLKLVAAFFFLTMIFFTPAVKYLLGISWGLSALLASIMSGTAPSVILMLTDKKVKAIEVLKIESIINTPITVLVPFIILDLMQTVPALELTTTIIDQLGPFLTKIVSGIGSGILIGVVLFKVLKRAYSTIYSPLAVMVSALITYVLAENLGGNGVLAVTTLGLFFGNVYVKEKLTLIRFESLLAKSLYILVFVLLGSVLRISFTKQFFILTGTLFLAYTSIRFVAVFISMRQEFELKEKLFISLINSKGIAVAVVAFFLTTINIPNMSLVLDVILVFILYSLVLSAFSSCFISHLVDYKR